MKVVCTWIRATYYALSCQDVEDWHRTGLNRKDAITAVAALSKAINCRVLRSNSMQALMGLHMCLYPADFMFYLRVNTPAYSHSIISLCWSNILPFMSYALNMMAHSLGLRDAVILEGASKPISADLW